MSESPQAITVPEAIGFWQKNKAWLWPAIMGVAGVIGGANVDKIPTPSLGGDTSAITARIDALEKQVKDCCGSKSPPSGGDGVIHVE